MSVHQRLSHPSRMGVAIIVQPVFSPVSRSFIPLKNQARFIPPVKEIARLSSVIVMSFKRTSLLRLPAGRQWQARPDRYSFESAFAATPARLTCPHAMHLQLGMTGSLEEKIIPLDPASRKKYGATVSGVYSRAGRRNAFIQLRSFTAIMSRQGRRLVSLLSLVAFLVANVPGLRAGVTLLCTASGGSQRCGCPDCLKPATAQATATEGARPRCRCKKHRSAPPPAQTVSLSQVSEQGSKDSSCPCCPACPGCPGCCYCSIAKVLSTPTVATTLQATGLVAFIVLEPPLPVPPPCAHSLIRPPIF